MKMRRAIAPFILLSLMIAGCEIEKDPVVEPLDPSLLLTDGQIWLGEQYLAGEVVVE